MVKPRYMHTPFIRRLFVQNVSAHVCRLHRLSFFFSCPHAIEPSLVSCIDLFSWEQC